MVLRKSPYRVWTTLAVAAFVAVASCPAAAQWAWKDDNGRTVYSDRPPPATVNTDRIVRQPPNKQTVLPTPAPADPAAKPAPDAKATTSATAPAAPKSIAEQEMEFRKRQQERADAEKKAQDEQTKLAAKAADCERAKGYLRAVEGGERITRTDAAGNREFLDDAQRAAEAERTRKLVQATCN
jgi:Domain of unknown function (DUF4124)